MKKYMHWFGSAVQLFGVVGVLSLAGCADDSFERQSGDNSGVRVSFVVSDAQQDALAEGKALVRGVSHGLSSEDLAPRRLAVEGDADASLVETTVEGVNPVVPSVAVRGNVVTSIASNFSTVGYRSASAGFSTASTPVWFHGKETQPNGTLVEPILWSWHQPYARFYAVWPKVEASDAKLCLSEASYVGVPYVDFEVSEAVREQRDLLTASSGQVHYAVQGQAPAISLRFNHALTAVRFAVGANLSWGKTISKVEIQNAFSKGRYTLAEEANGSGAWSELSARKTFALDGIAVSTSALVNHVLTGRDGDNFTFFMLPQTLTGNNVKAKIYFSDQTDLTVTLTGSWLAGTTKTYTLSQKASGWEYVLTAESPAALAYNVAQSGEYKITSYRQTPDGSTKHAVAWKVVGYDSIDDGNDAFSMEQKPSWLTSLSTNSGNGSATGAADAGRATVKTTDLIDSLALRNQDLKNAPAKGSAGNYYNLANQSGAVNIENTANCYVISAPGFYRLPLVYGNAVKNSIPNTLSYQSGVSGIGVLDNFKSHDGTNITSPYINVQHNTNPATKASIVWADAQGLVSNPTVQGEEQNAFLTFEVKQENLVNGNAVVAVKNASGTVMWSWHLWFAPQRALAKIPVTNRTTYAYYFTEEALGWKYTDWYHTSYNKPRSVKVKVEQVVANNASKQVAVFEIVQNPGGVKQGLTTLYQFGRKDAFPATNDVAEGSFTPNAGNNMSFIDGIQNPDKFYTWSFQAWSVGGAYGHKNLWSGQNTIYGFNDIYGIKTIYDPCPVGFSIPASNAFTGFTTSGEAVSSKEQVNGSHWSTGWSFYTNTSKTQTIFFPASGYRDLRSGSLYYVNSSGYYWTATPRNEDNGCAFIFNETSANPQRSDGRSYGFGVRPVSR